MTDHQKAFKEAENELSKERIDQIKKVMKSILQAEQEAKEEKIAAEEKLRILKLDKEDLRNGKIDKIKERHEKSKKARDVSPIPDKFIQTVHGPIVTDAQGFIASNPITDWTYWNDTTSGTYTVMCSNGTTKDFFLG